MCGMQIAVTAVSSSLSGFEMGTETENAEDAKVIVKILKLFKQQIH